MDEDEIVRRDLARLAVKVRLPATVDEHEDLISGGMDLVADLAPDRDRHHDDLFVLSRQQFAPERVVGPDGSEDINADFVVAIELISFSRATAI